MMLLDTLFSRIRVFRVRLRYPYYKAKFKHKNLKFIWDNSDNYQTLKQMLKQKQYKKVVIIGNAPNITDLSDKKYRAYQNDPNTLTIGLNRSYLLFHTNIVLFGDHFVMQELAKERTKIEPTTFLFASQLLDDRLSSLKWWKEHKTLKNYPYKTLFKARTILISALALAYTLEIKEIHLYGVSLDDGKRFYENEETNNKRQTIEFLSQKQIDKQQLGYDVQKIVKEVIKSMIQEGFQISYGGESNFLSSLKGIKKC